jgi:hypothetical protein
MFRAGADWAGLLIGVATVVTREYLRRPKMAQHEEMKQARDILRAMLWERRDEHLDRILLHDCDLHDLTILLIETAGWHETCFTMAALADDYAVLCD